MPGHVLVGDELDLEIIAAGLPPSDFLGANLPTPPPPPSPTPSQAAHCPSPPPITVLETGEPLSVATPSPPPVPSGRKWARGKKKRARDPRAPESSSFQREVRKPPVIRIPPVRARPSAGRDPSQPLRSFPAERFRPTGVVVRTLFPPCKYCNNNGRLCTLEANHPLAAKTPRCCSHCKAAPITCPSWTRFSNVFEDGDDEILGEFLVLLWEHLGDGSFVPLEPDPRWSDLTQTRVYGSRFFLSPLLTALLSS
jgi:hypothetical protein